MRLFPVLTLAAQTRCWHLSKASHKQENTKRIMVRLRLKRLGKKKKPFYRIVVTDKRERRDCDPIQELGYYNPVRKQLKLDKEAALTWVSKGAQPTDAVKRLIEKADGSNELQQLEVVKKERISKKAKARQEAEKADAESAKAAAATATAEPEAKAEEAAPAAEAEKPAEEAPPAEEG